MPYDKYTVEARGDATFDVVRTETYTHSNGTTYEWDVIDPDPDFLTAGRLERLSPDKIKFILTDETP